MTGGASASLSPAIGQRGLEEGPPSQHSVHCRGPPWLRASPASVPSPCQGPRGCCRRGDRWRRPRFNAAWLHPQLHPPRDSCGPVAGSCSQPLSCLPLPLAGGWGCGHPLPRADMSRSRTRSSGQCRPLSGQGGPSCPGSGGLAFTPPPAGLGVQQGRPRTPTLPVAHPSSFGGAGLAQREPTWLAR